MVEAAGPTLSLSNVRLLAVCLVAFAGFLRCDELIKLRCKDMSFNELLILYPVKQTSTGREHPLLLHVLAHPHAL